MSTIQETATQACKDILEKNLGLRREQRVILIHQRSSEIALNGILTDAYTEALKDHEAFESIEFDPDSAATLKHKLFHLNKEDVVILIQDRSFRLSDFRIRLDLKNKGIYVIEHNHIDHTTNSEEIETYVKALQYDGNYFESVASMMQKKLGTSSEVKIVSCDGSELTYSGPVESVKKNIGDLHANLGSFYPIGEVFTEPVDLESVSGEFLVYAFPNLQYKTIIVDPFKVIVRKGKVVSHNGPKEFSEIIDLIKTENSDEKVWIREMGFGLNRNIGKNKPLTFVSAHERQQGYHISLGLKHGVFRKKIPKKVNQRFHIDMFVDVSKMLIDGECVFSEEKYLIE